MSENEHNQGPEEPDLATKLNLETGQLSWPELQRHFARGMVVVVGQDLDLVEVAIKLTEDDKASFEYWTEQRKVWRANDDDALRWQEAGANFWSVVVAPWVLVQEMEPKQS